MTDFAPADLPLEIDRIHGSRPSLGEVRLVLSGRWRGDLGTPPEEALLVVQVEGRRHRFPAERDRRTPGVPPGRWQATFELPDWAEPHQDGQAAVWIGDSVVPVPPLRGVHPSPAAVPAPRAPAEGSIPQVETEPVLTEPRVQAQRDVAAGPVHARSAGDLAEVEAPRAGPLADLLLKETIAALHTELEHRTTEAARLRAAVGDARGEAEARLSRQAELETALGELGAELKRLMEAVEEQRAALEEEKARSSEQRVQAEQRLSELAASHEQQVAELTAAHERRLAELAGAREALASSQVAREAAFSEVAGLQAEMSRIGAELAVTRERVSTESGDLGEATRLLADARALAEQLQRERDGD